MKLLGARFRNFACFEECFVPLDETVHLLVGRNNAGKTALLRGLTALSSLPVPGRTALDQQLREYCWNQSDDPPFGLDLLFAAESNDTGVLGQLTQSPLLQSAANGTVEYNFKANCSSGRVDLLGASFSYATRKIVLLENGQQLAYSASGQLTGRSSVTQEFLSPLANLNTVLVAAHRVVRPWSLQQQNLLLSNAESLAAVLDELYGNDRDKFAHIEAFVISVFPEFRYVNPVKQQGTMALITLTRQNSDQKVPLTHCGTGVEQVLALATFIFTSKPGTLLLLDEPHSYLHPIAERALIRLILTHGKHRYVISTHSAILINAVTPDRILSLNSAKITREAASEPSDLPQILHSLGYQNSDLLFSDRLVFVEGETERTVLPRLLSLSRKLNSAEIERTGFPDMDGNGRLNGRTRQTSLLHFEKLLRQLGRAHIPRVYLFDGDCTDDDKTLLTKTPLLRENPVASVVFLPRCEIENYLLVPDAISEALRASAKLEGKEVQVKNDDVVKRINDLLAAKDDGLFLSGKGDDPRKTVKASKLLEEIFDQFGLRYNKSKTGHLIAQRITAENATALEELSEAVGRIFTIQEVRSRFA